MLVSGVSTSPQVVEGTIQRIDLVGRTVAVLLPHELRIFDVPHGARFDSTESA